MDRLDRERSVHVMGGLLTLRVRGSSEPEVTDRRLELVASRIRAWSDRLTRFDPRSELCAVNRSDGAGAVPVGPTLAAVLDRATRLNERTGGLVDVTLLDERLDAERPGTSVPGRAHARSEWSLCDPERRKRRLERCPGVRFDLDGVAKGWIADRARALLSDMPSAMVDADGDIALHVAPGSDWEIAVADPRDEDRELARIRVGDRLCTRILGIATSGISIHRWERSDGNGHHLIDPRTRRPAVTDVVQASVVAEDATTAEGLAKAAVIAGSDAAQDLLERAGAWAAVLLLADGDVIASPATSGWLVQ